MPNTKSQKKRMVTNEKSRQRNRAVKSQLKTATRHVKNAVAEGDGYDAYAYALDACRLMDKAVSKGVIHKNQAANRKSGIMKLANTIVTDEDIAEYEKPAKKQPKQTGNKKAARKAERKAEKEAAEKEKAARRKAHEKEEAAAQKRKEKAEAEAAAAEAEAAAAEAEAADGESVEAAESEESAEGEEATE